MEIRESVKNKCIICSKARGSTPLTLTPSRESLEKVKEYANKRASYGETVFSPLCDKIASLPDGQYCQSVYHYGCYQNVVHKEKLQRAEKRFREASSSSKSVVPPKKGRPSKSHSPTRSKEGTGTRLRRSVGASQIKSCVFQCPNASSGELHRAESEAMGSRLMFIKSGTQDEKVRIALANVNEPSDCAAFELMYHRNCLREHERKIQQTSSNSAMNFKSKIGKYIADIDILNAVKCSLTSGSTITMNEINEEYVSLLNENDVDIGARNHKKHLKTVISENIENAKFVKSHRAYESECVLSEKLLGETVSEVRDHQNEEDDIKCIAKAAAILRKELTKNTQWKFTGSQSLSEFQSSPTLKSFLRWLLFGTKVRDVKGKRDEAAKIAINLVSQQILQNFKTDRQTAYQSKSDIGFQTRIETPLSVGLSLTVHKKTRSKSLVDVLSQLQIGSTYDKVINIERRIACGVADRMKTTGGFCLPPFIVKGKSVYFAADNIDFLENTADGQNTLHGTMLVVNQNKYNKDGNDVESACVPVNEPLRIPDEIDSIDVNPNLKYAPAIVAKPINVDSFEFKFYDKLLTKYQTRDRVWFMASFSHREKSSFLNTAHPEEKSTVPDDLEQQVTRSPTSMTSDQAMCLDNPKQHVEQSPSKEQPSEDHPRIPDDFGQHGSEHPAKEQSTIPHEIHRLATDSVVKKNIMPTWAATNSIVMQLSQEQNQTETHSAIVAPLIRRPPTDYAALYTVLCLAQGISAFVVGPNHKTVITLDLDLYERALKLQSSTGNSNWILRVGELHACFASLHAIAKYVEDSGLDAINIEAGIYSPATIRQIFTGKWFKRGVEFHMTNIMACYELFFEASSQQHDLETMIRKCNELRKKLHSRQSDVTGIFEEVSALLRDQFQASTLEQDIGEMAQFLMIYMKQVESLLHVIRASRQGEWELHLAAIEEQVKYYFAHDLYKYARLVPVYLAQMQMLKKSDEETWKDLKSGDFMVKKSGIPFTNLFVDQTLEQLIRELKVAGGVTGITQNEDALGRFFLIGPELVMIIQDFQNAYCTSSDQSAKEHYQLSGSIAVRMFNNSAKIKESIVKHCGGNPFSNNTNLMNLVSNMVVPETAKEDILHRDNKGTEKFEEFVSERVVAATATKSVWDPMKKMKLKTFSTSKQKVKCKVGNKLVKLREDRQLLARFLIVQQSRPGMIESLSETIGKYEFSVIPRALFSSDGSLLIPTDKSAFIHAIEEYNPPNMEPGADFTHDTPDITDIHGNVCIVDAMAVVQAIKKGPSMLTCSDFANAFVGSIKQIISRYDEGRVIFDRYIDNSLKAQTRGKRSAGIEPVKFEIKDSTNIKLVPLKALLSHIETKSKLTEYLGKALLRQYSESSKNIVVVYGTAAYSNKQDVFDSNIGKHSHEEADTLIPMHVLDASRPRANGDTRDIDVYSPDTDVFIYLMDLFSTQEIPGELRFITGKGKAKRTIDIRARCTALGQEKCRGLLGLHAFSGADCGGKFAGISKNRWIKTYLRLEPSSEVINVFQKLGEDDFNLDRMASVLENFVCTVYAQTSTCKTVKELRWELFKCKNLEAEKLPPTLGALKPHIQRANFISLVGKGYKEPLPQLPPLSENGWERSPDGSGTFSPMKCLELPAPQAVIELVKCGCRHTCSSHCSCLKNDLPCTALCKCSDCENTTDYKVTQEEDFQ